MPVGWLIALISVLLAVVEPMTFLFFRELVESLLLLLQSSSYYYVSSSFSIIIFPVSLPQTSNFVVAPNSPIDLSTVITPYPPASLPGYPGSGKPSISSSPGLPYPTPSSAYTVPGGMEYSLLVFVDTSFSPSDQNTFCMVPLVLTVRVYPAQSMDILMVRPFGASTQRDVCPVVKSPSSTSAMPSDSNVIRTFAFGCSGRVAPRGRPILRGSLLRVDMLVRLPYRLDDGSVVGIPHR
mmetsp:Transcript_30741/g.62299  ORF Transcript_30741/g.62299 Transcript_30741/m.62299 type:complete len:238 (-) Transcript_30741:518-1231(-)